MTYTKVAISHIMIYSCTFIVFFFKVHLYILSRTSFSFHGILLIAESQTQVVVYCTTLLMQLIIHAKLLLLLKFYLLKIISLFYGFFFFFFFCNRKYSFLYILLFAFITFSEVFLKTFKCFSEVDSPRHSTTWNKSTTTLSTI